MCDGSCLRQDEENHSSLAFHEQGERSLNGQDTGSGIGPSACRARARCFVCGRMKIQIHAFPSLYRGRRSQQEASMDDRLDGDTAWRVRARVFVFARTERPLEPVLHDQEESARNGVVPESRMGLSACRARARVFVSARTERPSVRPGSAPTYRRRWSTPMKTGRAVPGTP